MVSFRVEPIPIYEDNYVWLLLIGAATWVVDPGNHLPVFEALRRHNRRLDGILVTHGHWDHVTGIAPLVDAFDGLPVVGSALCQHPAIDHPMREGDVIDLSGLSVEVWETPGHTRDHLSFYIPAVESLFCGDTLFAAGCGRVFDGSMEQLYHSLKRIAALPRPTKIYCTHEYTLANLAFALAVEPDSAALHQRQKQCRAQRDAGHPSLPTDLATELATNPFLRTDQPSVRQSVKKAANLMADDDFLIFTELRKWKNRY